MPAVPPDLPLIQRCRQAVRIQADALIGRCVDAARASLADAARDSRAAAARQSAQDALDAMDQCRAAICTAFPAALDQALTEAVADSNGKAMQTAPRDPAPASGETAVDLALLDDDALTRLVEAARLEQAVQPVVEHALARLDALMSSALAQPVIRPDLNPLRPAVPCRALMQALDAHGSALQTRRLWLRHLAQPWARELCDLYAAVSDLLEQQGVGQARYRVKPTEGGAGLAVAVSMPMGMAADRAPEMPGLCQTVPLPTAPAPVSGMEDDLSDAEVIRRRRAPTPGNFADAGAGPTAPPALEREFLPNPQNPQTPQNPQLAQTYDAPLPPDYYAALCEQLAQLAQLAQLGALDQTTAIAPSQAHERVALEIQARATRVSQARGIDAVRALMANLAGDARILPPLRQVIVALEPALLRLALAEPGFLADDRHPARRFIEALVQRGFRFNDEGTEDFEGFIAPVRTAIGALIALAEPTGPDFDQHLQALQACWQPADAAAKQAAERGQQVLTFAQARQRLADRIAWDFSQRSDLTGVPAAVTGFLFRDWSLVIAHAQLADTGGQLDPGGYLSIVTSLLWSVKRDQILNDSARLFEVVPRVLATLRRGLEMLGKDPHESQALFDMLLGFHEPVLKLRRARIALDQGVTPEELAEALDLADVEPTPPGAPPQPQHAEQAWIGQHERQAVGFIDGEAMDARLVERAGAIQSDQPSSLENTSADDATEARVKTALGQLRRGDWVDLYWRQTWRRVELTWVSEDGALYLFVSHAGTTHGMTRATLETLLRARQLRPLETGLVAQAIRTCS